MMMIAFLMGWMALSICSSPNQVPISTSLGPIPRKEDRRVCLDRSFEDLAAKMKLAADPAFGTGTRQGPQRPELEASYFSSWNQRGWLFRPGRASVG
jgi:hypothetical protein